MRRDEKLTMGRASLVAILSLLIVLMPAWAFTTKPPEAPPHFPEPSRPAQTQSDIEAFATELERIRQDLKIPGMSAAIVQDQEIVWAQGFGYADVERQLPATPDTPYHLASVTKPIAATLLMQLVEEERLSLDDPVSIYGIQLPESGVTVRHLLTHTSAGTPGSKHDYDGNRYSLLARVFAIACDQSFGRCLSERIINPLGMSHTVPNPSWGWAGWDGYMASMGFGQQYRQFPRVYGELARPYQFDAAYHNVPGAYPLYFSPAAGLIASVVDIARFDVALDRDRLVGPETRAQMFAPAVSNAGQPLIYGLGWYSQVYDDERLIWHSGGWTPSVSALYLKVPDENLTFIILANNYNLTRPYPFDAGDVLYSTPALAFYKMFVLPRQSGKTVPSIDWSAGEEALVTRLNEITDGDVRAIVEQGLWSYRKLYASIGEDQQADRLARIHRYVFSDFSLSRVNPVTTGANHTTPQPQTVSLLPAQASILSRLLFVWLILTLFSLLVLIVHRRQRATVSRAYFAVWFLITMLFGLLGLAAYLLCEGRSAVRQRVGGASSPRLMALRSALYSVTGNMAGLLLASFVIYFYFPDVQQGAVPAVASMFLVNWLIFQAPIAARVQRPSYLSALRDTLADTAASTVFILLGALPVMIALTEGLFLHVAPDSPLYLVIVQAAAIAGSITVYPYAVWSLRRNGDRKAQIAAAMGGE